jgi:GNAT superfamily N-acetyltransferase
VTVTVTKTTSTDMSAIAAVLADAFLDDPVGQWLAPDTATRVATLTAFFELEVGSFTLPHGEVRHAGSFGAALWVPPGRWQIPPLLVARNLPRMGRIFGRRTPLILRGLSRIEHVHPREPHWYLPFVGVATEHQGRGIGSALLTSVLDQCDRDALPAYLEATCEQNRALYARHGFAVREEVRLPKGPTLWPMWREPRAAAR